MYKAEFIVYVDVHVAICIVSCDLFLIQVRGIIVRTSDPAFNAYGGGGPPWRSIGLKMSPVRRKFSPWELMARATKYEPQVGASAGASGGARCV